MDAAFPFMCLLARSLSRRFRPRFPARRAWCGLVFAVAAVATVTGGLGCTAPVPRTELAVELRFENLTDLHWEVRGQTPLRTEPYVWRVTPNASLTVRIPAGEWAFAQEVLPNGPSRRTEARLEAGENYEWPLATLLSVSRESAAAFEPVPHSDD